MTINFRLFEVYLGNHPKRIQIKFQRNTGWYRKDYKKFKFLSNGLIGAEFPISDNFPCLNDRNDEAGITRTDYFIQDLYCAQKIFERKPDKHVDVGSRIGGFVAHVASYRTIELIDIRKMESTIKNVSFKQADLMDENNIPLDYCDSISSLHALEHFGLGRYGDPIDPEGHIKGFRNITKMLKKGGIFYFSVPMGRQRIDFNAHRVFGMPYLIRMVETDYDIITFSYVNDSGDAYYNVELTEDMISSSLGCELGCAIFELRKK